MAEHKRQSLLQRTRQTIQEYRDLTADKPVDMILDEFDKTEPPSDALKDVACIADFVKLPPRETDVALTAFRLGKRKREEENPPPSAAPSSGSSGSGSSSSSSAPAAASTRGESKAAARGARVAMEDDEDQKTFVVGDADDSSPVTVVDVPEKDGGTGKTFVELPRYTKAVVRGEFVVSIDDVVEVRLAGPPSRLPPRARVDALWVHPETLTPMAVLTWFYAPDELHEVSEADKKKAGLRKDEYVLSNHDQQAIALECLTRLVPEHKVDLVLFYNCDTKKLRPLLEDKDWPTHHSRRLLRRTPERSEMDAFRDCLGHVPEFRTKSWFWRRMVRVCFATRRPFSFYRKTYCCDPDATSATSTIRSAGCSKASATSISSRPSWPRP